MSIFRLTKFSRSQNKTTDEADLPPVQVALSHSPTNLDELHHLAVDLLAVGRKIGQGEVPPAVALVDHVAELVEGLLDGEVVPFHEERYQVVVDTKLEVLAVRQDIVDSRGRGVRRSVCRFLGGTRVCLQNDQIGRDGHAFLQAGVVEDVLRQLDALAVLVQDDGRVPADRAPAQVHVRVDVAGEVVAADLLVDLHEELCEVSLVLVYPPLLHLCGG